MDVRRTVRCTRCQKDFAFDSVRRLPTRSAFACKPCLGIVEKELDIKKKRIEKLFDFQCLGCHYQFRRSAENVPRVCPQCGESGFVKFEKDKLSSKHILRLADDPRLDKMNKISF